MQCRLPGGDPRGSRAGRWRLAGHTCWTELPRAEANQDGKMGRTLPGQLTAPGDKETAVAKDQGIPGTPEAVWGGFPVKAEHYLHPRGQPRQQGIPHQPAPAVPAAPCTHRTSGLRISRPGGRGYKARILSHKARSQGSTTASGLQVGNMGCSSTASSLQPQELLPCTQKVLGRPWATTSAPLSLHSHCSLPPSATPSTHSLAGPKP